MMPTRPSAHQSPVPQSNSTPYQKWTISLRTTWEKSAWKVSTSCLGTTKMKKRSKIQKSTMVQSWFHHGSLMVHWWFIDGSIMVQSWCNHGSTRVQPGFNQGSTMVHLWFIYGSSRVQPWCNYGSTRVHLWFICGAIRVQSWFNHGSSITPG